MKNILITLFVAFVVFSCQEQELVPLNKPTQETATTLKSSQGWELDDPDQKFLYATDAAFEQGMVSILDAADENDIVVAQLEGDATAAYVYIGMGPFWMDPGVINGKEICKGRTGIRFAKCIKGYVDQGHRVTLWLDKDGNYRASI